MRKLLIVALAGCASARAPRGEHGPQDPARVARVEPAVIVVALPSPLEAPSEIACTLTVARWPSEAVEDASKADHFLRFSPGHRPFARVIGGTDVSLAIPVALASAGGTLKIDAKGVVVAGHIEADEMPLYPARAFVVAESFIPDAARRLAWRSAKPGAMTIVADGGPRVRSVHGELIAERPCADISIGAVPIDAAAIDAAMNVTKAPEPKWPGLWLKPGPAWISAVPNGDAVARVDVVAPPDDTVLLHPVRILATQRDWTRVSLDAFGGTVFGWVRNADLAPSKTVYVDLQHDSMSILVPGPPEPGDYIACKNDLPLVAEIGGEQHVVGTVRAGSPFKKSRALPDWTDIEFQQTGILATEGATFRVRTSDIQDCK